MLVLVGCIILHHKFFLTSNLQDDSKTIHVLVCFKLCITGHFISTCGVFLDRLYIYITFLELSKQQNTKIH